jgi:hypothetical protein
VGPASPGIRFRPLNYREDHKSVSDPDGRLITASRRRTRGASKYAHLLEEDRRFNALYRKVFRGSYNTGAWYLLRIGRLYDEVTRVSM